jgi:hypothetical protein
VLRVPNREYRAVVSVCIGVHLFAGKSNIMPRRRANVGRRTRRAERATATRGRVQLVSYIYSSSPPFVLHVMIISSSLM